MISILVLRFSTAKPTTEDFCIIKTTNQIMCKIKTQKKILFIHIHIFFMLAGLSAAACGV
jgi:hypothetical protein